MKVPRFVKEYACYKMREFEENELMKPEHKEIARVNCDKAVWLLERGFITVDESMSLISGCLEVG